MLLLEAADVTAAAAREVGAAMSAAATAVEINAIVLVAAALAASVEVATAFASPFQVLWCQLLPLAQLLAVWVAAGAADEMAPGSERGTEKTMEDWPIGIASDVTELGESLTVNGRGLPVIDADMPGIGMDAPDASGQAEEMAPGMLMVGCEAKPLDVAVELLLLWPSLVNTWSELTDQYESWKALGLF